MQKKIIPSDSLLAENLEVFSYNDKPEEEDKKYFEEREGKEREWNMGPCNNSEAIDSSEWLTAVSQSQALWTDFFKLKDISNLLS